eukprot:9316221-Alexandrium_andersonii.AAC.1
MDLTRGKGSAIRLEARRNRWGTYGGGPPRVSGRPRRWRWALWDRPLQRRAAPTPRPRAWPRQG